MMYVSEATGVSQREPLGTGEGATASGDDVMAQARATVKGRGPELFGRGIDLLFGEEASVPLRAPSQIGRPASGELPEATGVGQDTSLALSDVPAANPLQDGASGAAAVTETNVDQFLRMAAEAFLRVQAQKGLHLSAAQPSRNASGWDLNPTAVELNQGDTVADTELDVPPLPEEPFAVPQDLSVQPAVQPVGDVDLTAGAELVASDVVETDFDVPPLPAQPNPMQRPWDDAPIAPLPAVGDTQLPPVIPQPIVAAEENAMSDQPAPADSADQPVVSDNGQPRKVAPPGVKVSGPVTALDGGQSTPQDDELSATLVDRELPAMSRKDIEEILQRLPKSDLRALDKQIDQLYEDVTVLFSGKRREITVVFDILRKARIILLKDPEHYAEAEYYVRQVQARVHQVRQSIDEGGRYWPRILIYQTAWLAVLAIVALITTVNGASFERWIAFLLGVPIASEAVGWAILFISTLAWGGIGGATSALWSLYFHISVQRDYEPIENLWYYTQPLIGMVLGGIVFLIMGAGFLVVEATPTVGVGSMGARLVPAVIAVIAGFRQAVVLDLIERIVGLIAPAPGKPPSEPPTEELSI